MQELEKEMADRTLASEQQRLHLESNHNSLIAQKESQRGLDESSPEIV